MPHKLILNLQRISYKVTLITIIVERFGTEVV